MKARLNVYLGEILAVRLARPEYAHLRPSRIAQEAISVALDAEDYRRRLELAREAALESEYGPRIRKENQ